MKNNSRASKGLVLVLALVMLVSVAIGGTVAWLLDKTNSITNTFTPTDIEVELDETTTNYEMIPGVDIAKDPKITVTSADVDCWLFVKVEKANAFDNFMTYNMASGWTQVPNVDGVFYKEVTKSDAAQEFPVLADNKVTVKDTVTKTMMNGLTANNQPKLTFTAYVVQKSAAATAEAAWPLTQVEANY